MFICTQVFVKAVDFTYENKDHFKDMMGGGYVCKVSPTDRMVNSPI